MESVILTLLEAQGEDLFVEELLNLKQHPPSKELTEDESSSQQLTTKQLIVQYFNTY